MELMTLLRAQWDRAAALALAGTALLILLLGYVGVSGAAFVAAQLPYFISAGFFGLFLLTIAATLWLSADLRDEWRELRELRLHLVDAEPDAAPRAAVVAGNGLVDSRATLGVLADETRPRKRVKVS